VDSANQHAISYRADIDGLRGFRRGNLDLRLRNGLRLLEILDGELELLDELLAALGGLPKLCTSRQRIGVNLRIHANASPSPEVNLDHAASDRRHCGSS
jgi:hypothetical protein